MKKQQSFNPRQTHLSSDLFCMACLASMIVLVSGISLALILACWGS